MIYVCGYGHGLLFKTLQQQRRWVSLHVSASCYLIGVPVSQGSGRLVSAGPGEWWEEPVQGEYVAHHTHTHARTHTHTRTHAHTHARTHTHAHTVHIEEAF